MQSLFLKPDELSLRWNVTISTLSQWRWNGRGPYFLKMGRRVLYKIEDVEKFEEQQRRKDTTCTGISYTLDKVK